MLWFNQDVKEAVDAPRLHHQLVPMAVLYEYGNTQVKLLIFSNNFRIIKLFSCEQSIIDGLEKLEHKTERYNERGSVICAIAKNATGIYANADFRKGGEVVGL